MWHEVQIAAFVRVVQVDGGRQDPFSHSQYGENSLNRPGGSQQVTGHGFGTTHSKAFSVPTKHRFNRCHFSNIPHLGRSAMGVDITDLLELEAGVPDCIDHGACGTLAIAWG